MMMAVVMSCVAMVVTSVIVMIMGVKQTQGMTP
jgi:hypothetical protein